MQKQCVNALKRRAVHLRSSAIFLIDPETFVGITF
jgi:hypothetical protein